MSQTASLSQTRTIENLLFRSLWVVSGIAWWFEMCYCYSSSLCFACVWTGVHHIERWIWEMFLCSTWETTAQNMQKHRESALTTCLKNWNHTTNRLCQSKEYCFNSEYFWWWSCLWHVTIVLGYQSPVSDASSGCFVALLLETNKWTQATLCF